MPWSTNTSDSGAEHAARLQSLHEHSVGSIRCAAVAVTTTSNGATYSAADVTKPISRLSGPDTTLQE